MDLAGPELDICSCVYGQAELAFFFWPASLAHQSAMCLRIHQSQGEREPGSGNAAEVAGAGSTDGPVCEGTKGRVRERETKRALNNVWQAVSY